MKRAYNIFGIASSVAMPFYELFLHPHPQGPGYALAFAGDLAFMCVNLWQLLDENDKKRKKRPLEINFNDRINKHS